MIDPAIMADMQKNQEQPTFLAENRGWIDQKRKHFFGA
jgi:hypothetical protein